MAIAKLTQADLDRVIAAVLREAQAGKVQAAKLLFDYLKLAVIQEEANPEEMTPEQRAEAFAELERWMQPGDITLPESGSRAPGYEDRGRAPCTESERDRRKKRKSARSRACTPRSCALAARAGSD